MFIPDGDWIHFIHKAEHSLDSEVVRSQACVVKIDGKL